MWCGARARPGPPEPHPAASGVTRKTLKQSIAPELLRPPMAHTGMAIGLLGGSFNPPHAGHLAISRHALTRLRLDRLWWLVTPGNPLKPRDELAELGNRLAAARALACDPRIEVTGFEASLGSPYTVDTLRHIRRRYRGVNFVWLMGADNLRDFHHWHDWQEIFHLLPIAVLDRPGYGLPATAAQAARTFARYRVDPSDAAGLAQMAPPAWTFLTLPLNPSSSTAIRRSGMS